MKSAYDSHKWKRPAFNVLLMNLLELEDMHLYKQFTSKTAIFMVVCAWLYFLIWSYVLFCFVLFVQFINPVEMQLVYEVLI